MNGLARLIPGERVVVDVPVRVADVGGWTDTWFGSPGRVCHLAVGPAVRVVATLEPRPPGDLGPVHLLAPALAVDHHIAPSVDGGWADPDPGVDPLLEHAVGAVLENALLPEHLGIEVTVTSAVPPGASLGTSAAVVVGVLSALDRLVGGGERTPAELAVLAHQVETERAGRESGVQDQWAAAAGGCGLLTIGAYPHATHERIDLAPSTVRELGERLVTVVLGAHDSSAVHAQVINDVVGCDGEDHERTRQALRDLAKLAGEAAAALRSGDVDRWAEALVEATDAQARLHPELVGEAHRRAIDVAKAQGAVGWKVNGAGGAGGSLTCVTGPGRSAHDLIAELRAVDPTWTFPDLWPRASG
ncbi:MAG: GHMP kinase [Aquihabitans sp.]